jgi:DnaJ-class molecular chaperone
MNNHYATLGVNQGSSKEDIKKAYKKLAMQHHPDKGGDEKKFKEIINAYNTLTDDKPQQASPFGRQSSHPFEDMGMFSHFFGGAFQQQQQQQQQKQQEILRKTLHISMKEAFFGVQKNINISSENPCTSCVKTCSECRGAGFKIVQSANRMGNASIIQSFQVKCTSCVDGKIKSKTCTVCNSKGVINTNKTINIILKAGVQTNENLRYENILPNTVIVFTVNIGRDQNYTITNNNLLYIHKISLFDSLFGTEFDIVHPSEEIIKVNTKDKNCILTDKTPMVLEGKGMTSKNSLQIQFQVVYPNINANMEEKDLIETKRLMSIYFK